MLLLMINENTVFLIEQKDSVPKELKLIYKFFQQCECSLIC